MGNHTATRARGRSSAGGGTGARSVEDKLAQARQRVAEREADVKSKQARYGELTVHSAGLSREEDQELAASFGNVGAARAALGRAQETLAKAEGRELGRGEQGFTREEYLSGQAHSIEGGRIRAVSPDEARAYLANPTPRGGAASKTPSERVTKTAAGPTPREREAERRATAAERTVAQHERTIATLQARVAALTAERDALKARVAGERSGKAAKTGEAGAKASGRGKGGKTAEETLRPITTAKDEPGLARRFDPYHAPDARYLRVLYGDHQLAQALEPYQHDLLRETARRLGMPTGRSKAATISNIVRHITHESYQETVAKLRRATERMNRDIGPGGTYDAQKDYYAE